MTYVAVIIGCAIVVAGLMLAFALGRAAAIGDTQEVAPTKALRPPVGDRRDGPSDRRAATRPWVGADPGRRREDALRAELAETTRRLREAEARLAVAEDGEGRGAA